jgi:uncharacterized membrane protein
MQGAAEARRRKRRADKAVVSGLCLMAVALLVSSWQMAPPLATTLAAAVGLVLFAYGVNVAWTIFYDREPPGPSS